MDTIVTEQRADDWIAFVSGDRARRECADTQNGAYYKLAHRLLQERVNGLESAPPQPAPDAALEIIMNCRKKADGTFARHYKRSASNSTLCGISLKTGTWDISRAQFITCTKCDRIAEKQTRKSAPDAALLAAKKALGAIW